MSKQKALLILSLVIAWLWMPVTIAEESPPTDIQSGTLLLKICLLYTSDAADE